MSQYKLSERSAEWPYNYLYGHSPESLELCQSLSDKLPHGSGINYTWHINRSNNRLFYASNSFDAMDEYGGYCHIYQFTGIYKYHGIDKFKECPYCINEYNDKPGYRTLFDLQRYGMTIETFTNYPDIVMDSGLYIKCKLCDDGKIKLPTFELIRVNWHGQKEYTCCGYGLRDYLFETLMLD